MNHRLAKVVLTYVGLSTACGACTAPGSGSRTGDATTSEVGEVGELPPVPDARLRATVFIGGQRLRSVEVLGVTPGVRAGDGSWQRQCGTGPADGLMTDVAVRMTTAYGCDGEPLDGATVVRPAGATTSSIDITIDIVDPACTAPAGFDGHDCDIEASAVVYCGPPRSFGAGELVFDPAALSDADGEPTSLPADIDVGRVRGWLEANRSAIDSFIATRAPASVTPTIDASTLSLEVGCIDPANGPGECVAPGANLERVDFVDRGTAGREVIVLVDQSGSISGLVDDQDHREGPSPNIPANFGDVASDRTALRLAAARRLARSLSPGDRVRFFGFNEEGVSEVDEGRLDGLTGTAHGRSNLWLAVETAYDALAAATGPATIVVLTDGFDTCNGELRRPCTAPCVTADYPALLARLEADQQIGRRVAIEVIQFEAVGYPGQDPRLIEAACVSGGHYRYLDSDGRDFGTRTQMFEAAVDNVVAGLGGHWQVAAAVPGYGAVAAGHAYAVDGTVTLLPGSKLVAAASTSALDVGIGGADGRPALVKPCSSAADCGTESSPCAIGCSAETRTCAPDPETLQPDLAACSADGANGFCCDGVCQTTGVCAACSF